MDESNVAITYETLFELLRREKNRGELQELDPAFYRNVINYLIQKRLLLDKPLESGSVFGVEEKMKTEKQLLNIHRLVRELYERREKKIVDMALNKSRYPSFSIDESSLLVEEIPFFGEIKSTFDSYRTDVLSRVLDAKEAVVIEEPKAEDSNLTKVKFTDKVDQFAGPDMELYGPYEKGATEYFDERIVKLLKARGCIE